MTVGTAPAVRVEFPLRTVSANVREHHMARHRRVQAERKATWAALPHSARPPSPPLVVTLTRLAPRAYDCDNLRYAMKACRDQVAAWLMVQDNDPRVRWCYAQVSAKEAVVRIEISEAT